MFNIPFWTSIIRIHPLIEQIQDGLFVVVGHSGLDDALRFVKVCSGGDERW